MGFYRLHPQSVPAGLTFEHNGDAFFPLYITQFLPAGIAGLVVASLLAAAMSCLAAGINSLIAILSKDFIENSDMVGPNRVAASELRERVKACEQDMEHLQVLALSALVQEPADARHQNLQVKRFRQVVVRA